MEWSDLITLPHLAEAVVGGGEEAFHSAGPVVWSRLIFSFLFSSVRVRKENPIFSSFKEKSERFDSITPSQFDIKV